MDTVLQGPLLSKKFTSNLYSLMGMVNIPGFYISKDFHFKKGVTPYRTRPYY